MLRRSVARFTLTLLSLTLLSLAGSSLASAQPAASTAPSGAPAQPTIEAAPGGAPTQPADAPPPVVYSKPAYPQAGTGQPQAPTQQPAAQTAPQAAPRPSPQQVYPQGYVAYPQPGQPLAPPRPRIRRGMLIAGAVVLGVSYVITSSTGVGLMDTDCCSDVGARLLVPVFGPYIAIGAAEHGRGALALLGAVQLVGAGLLIGGIARFVRSKHEVEAQGVYTLHMPHGRSLSFDASTTPVLTGPSMSLRF